VSNEVGVNGFGNQVKEIWRDIKMLNQRYEYDGNPLLNLNELQLKMKQNVEKKVKDKIYMFEEAPCPICNSSNFELLANKDRYGLYMPVVICKDCGLIQTNPRMDQSAYNEFYNVEYRKLYVGEESPTDVFFKGQYYKGRRIFQYLNTTGLIKDWEKMFILEVGCGAGGILQYFKEMGCRVKGLDLGDSYIQFGKKQYDLDLSVGTIKTVYLNSSPDLIIYSHVLEHVLLPNDELERVRNILSDTGILYIEVPGVKNLMHRYEMDFLRLLQNAHTYHFTKRSLENLLRRNGFEMVLGNESIFSVSKKNPSWSASLEFESDYSGVLEYLHKVERLRKFYPISTYRIRQLSKSIIVKVLKAVGLFDPIRNLYRQKKASS
jgi:2-polyprenyl-3-methyl-5-hydroxy-6-metoxy-1,4-benzoquinol methylase